MSDDFKSDFVHLTNAVRDLVALSEVQMRLVRHQSIVIKKLIIAAGDKYDQGEGGAGSDIREMRALFDEVFEVYRKGSDFLNMSGTGQGGQEGDDGTSRS